MATGLHQNGQHFSERSAYSSLGMCRVELWLNDEEAAAVDGWREANRIADYSDALREIIRLGLLSEIAKIYRMVADRAD